jgi:soluble lytic murein transglycosylase
VRLERWDEARRSLELLADKDHPELRYVRARVAAGSGDPKAALLLLEGLETSLPLLTDEILRHRAEAALIAGPFALAAEYFAARPGVSALLKAAHAFQQAGDLARARALCDRVLNVEKRSRLQEADARTLRLTLGSPSGPTELADARWLAVAGADHSAAPRALAILTASSQPLSAREHLTRAEVLADAGRTDDALRALDEAERGQTEIPKVERLHLRGMVLYRSRARYLEAAEVLRQAALLGGPRAADDAFHAARSLSRGDRDEEAIWAYEAVAKKYPDTRWGDQATYFVPYLRILHGEWTEAARGFDDYVRRYPNGVEKADVTRNRAIAHFMSGHFRLARQLFEKLADDDRDGLAGARSSNLAALAALRDGDRMQAVSRWTEIARTRPLSYPALVARARLVQAGAAVPPMIEPALSGSLPAGLPGLPPPADLLARLGLDGEAEAAMRDREGVIVASSSGRTTEGLCGAYGQLDRARRRAQVAHQIPSVLLQTAPGGRNRWAWECSFPRPYEAHVEATETREGLPRDLLYAVMKQESAFDPGALSPARAVGLLQLLADTAKTVAGSMELSFDEGRLTSPDTNIVLGARFLRDLLTRFRGQIPLAAAAYNAGPEAIARWVARSPGMELDVFVERIPYRETRDYVGRVLGNLARYGYLRSGDGGVPTLDLALPR